MTSDAKIGLLLGLVFIFVIAFVINGLPSLRPPISKVEATTMGTDVDFTGTGVAGKAEQGVPSWVDGLDQQRTGDSLAPAVAAEPQPSVPELPMVPPAQVSPPTANQEGVRSTYSLENLLNQLTPVIKREPVSTINVDTPRPAAEAPVASSHPPVAAAPAPRPEPVLPPKPAPQAPTRVEPQQAPKPAAVASAPPAIPPGAKLYVVVEGDNLGTIAKKAYGPEEGNRMVNCDRIYLANQHIMPSRDSVVVGQKLIIPPLPKPTTTAAPAAVPAPKPNRPADVLPKDLFEKPKTASEPMTIAEKVEALAIRAPAAIPAPVFNGRWYTVQDGDNLWKIAASQLGAGSRWDEIHKLNADLLASQDSLKVGMKLRLPSK
jgi:nucleoid-associated protein YgaU